MEVRREQLQTKLDHLLKEAAEVSAELQKIDGTQPEVPHYSQIEMTAHATGQQLSRMIQQARLQEVALAAMPQAACPTCGDVCEVAHPRRSLTSIDGPVEALEPKAPYKVFVGDGLPANWTIWKTHFRTLNRSWISSMRWSMSTQPPW